MTARAAAIDIGTNSVLLTVAERRGTELVPLLERATITRLGAGVDATRALDPQACERTLACLESHLRELQSFGEMPLDVVGTSALRDASGGAGFVERVAELLGTQPRVLSGAEEAELVFEGATIGIDVSGPLVVFDIGGGSTEIVSGEIAGDERTLEAAVSLDIGSVRLFERHVRSDPPTARELACVDEAIAEALEQAPRYRKQRRLVGTAGTVTTLAALDRSLAAYDAALVHGARLTRSSVERLAHELARLTGAERRELPGLEPGRADVIVVGARLTLALCDWANADELTVSDRGVRWGLLFRRLR